MLWMSWWAWVAGALVFAILEILAPIFVFSGMTIGALVIGVLLAFGVSFGGSLEWIIAVFAGVSLLATLAVRVWLGPRRGETKIIREDINKRPKG